MSARGFLRAEGLVLVVLLLASLGILGWVAYQMHEQSQAQRKVVEAAPTGGKATAEVERVTGIAEVPTGQTVVASRVAGGGETGGAANTMERSMSELGGAERVGRGDIADELAEYSNALATLRVQMALMEEARARERAEVEERMRREIEGLREELARQQTQAFLAERELLKANLRVDAAEEARRRAERELAVQQEEVQRLRQMIEELSGAEPPVFQPAAFTNAAVERVDTERREASTRVTDGVSKWSGEAEGSSREVNTGAYVRITRNVGLGGVGGNQQAVKVLATSEEVSAPRVSAPELRRSAETERSDEQREVEVRAGGVQLGAVVPQADGGATHDERKEAEVGRGRVEREDVRRWEDEEGILLGGEEGKNVPIEEEVLATPSQEIVKKVARMQPEFRPEGGEKPSLVGMMQGGYRVLSGPLMAPYGVYSGVAASLEGNTEVGGRTNDAAIGAGELVVFPLRMGVNVVAGAGAGTMDAVVGCLDLVTLGTYEGTNSKPHLIEVINDVK